MATTPVPKALSRYPDESNLHEETGAEPTEGTPLLAGGPLALDGSTEASTLVGTPPSSASPITSPPTTYTTPTNGSSKPSAASASLPKLQIFLLCYTRMLEPIAFFSIFPFIAQMVQRNGHLPESDVGFYSGLIESLFSATQMVVLIFWGRLADRVGRKPMLLCSLVGTTVSMALFGLAQSIWQMVLFRCLAGMFSGSSLIIRTMISENSNAQTQARAFSWFAFSGNVGIFAGPLLGGALANPAEQFGWEVEFFKNYPYALPGFVIGAISAAGTIIVALFLKETLDKDKPTGNDSASEQPPSRELPSIWTMMRWPGVGIVIWNYGYFMMLAFAYTAIIPVALYTPVILGGLGFSSFEISVYMAVVGASQAIWLLVIFPPLQHRVGTKGTLRVCAMAYPLFFPGFIVLNVLLRDGGPVARVWFWIVAAVLSIVGPGVSMAFTGVQLAVNEVSPTPHVLGTLNAIALTASSGIRAVVPGVSTALYAVGVRNKILYGHMAWVILSVLSVVLIPSVGRLPRGRIPAKERENEEREAEAGS